MARSRMVFVHDSAFWALPVPAWAAAVAAAVPELDVVCVGAGEDPAPHLADADAVFGILTPELLAATPRLRWLQAPMAAPPPAFFFPELVAHPVVITNLRGVYRDNLADHIMAFVLAFARALPRWSAQQARGEWFRDVTDTGTTGLAGTTMLLVGAGEVGVATARRARAFGIRVVGVDAVPENVRAELDELHHVDALDDVLACADWVVISVPHTPESEGMFDAGRFARMKPTARVINVGRGETVRLDDLTAALVHGTIAGAAIDVSELEPLPPDHPLWTAPGAIVTPHVAGFGADTDREREAVIVENARRFVAGEPLRYVIDKRRRY